MTPLQMIDEFQCPGCIHGVNTTECEKFEKRDDGTLACKNHRPSTFIGGIGRIALGLPKGFNRCGTMEWPETPHCFIRLYEKPKDRTEYNKFNMPVWAMEKDGFLFVRCYSPRVNWTFVDVIQGGKLEHAPGALNVAEFIDDMD